MKNLKVELNKLLDAYNNIKERVKREEPYLFERWKAGGFIVDEDIVSMYPNVVEVVESCED